MLTPWIDTVDTSGWLTLGLGRYFKYRKYGVTCCFRWSIPRLSILSVSIPVVRYCSYLLETQSFRYLLTKNIPICHRNVFSRYRSSTVSVLSIESIESLCFGIDIVSVPSIGQALVGIINDEMWQFLSSPMQHQRSSTSLILTCSQGWSSACVTVVLALPSTVSRPMTRSWAT